jgi:hypothetical protein
MFNVTIDSNKVNQKPRFVVNFFITIEIKIVCTVCFAIILHRCLALAWRWELYVFILRRVQTIAPFPVMPMGQPVFSAARALLVRVVASALPRFVNAAGAAVLFRLATVRCVSAVVRRLRQIAAIARVVVVRTETRNRSWSGHNNKI